MSVKGTYEDATEENKCIVPHPARRHSRRFIALTIAGLTISLAAPAQAGTDNLIANPEFMATSGSSQTQLTITSPAPAPTFNGAEVGPWTQSGFIVLFGPASGMSGTNADLPPGAANTFAPSGGFCLYGPGSGGCGGASNNGLSLGPNGGNFLALDGALTSANTPPVNIQGKISQTIGGLTPGLPVTVTFNWAAAQQAGFLGTTTEQLAVSLGGQIESTNVVTNPQGGFQKWMSQQFTFNPPTSTSEVLSFLAIGTPATGVANAGPPFVLLESPSLTQVPVPASWSLLILGFAGIAICAYWRRKPVGVAEAGAA